MANTDPKIATWGQWKDLANRVKNAGGRATELTSADYNYPSGTSDGVALWKLNEGTYFAEGGVKVYENTSQGTSTTLPKTFNIVKTRTSASTYTVGIFVFVGDSIDVYFTRQNGSAVVDSGGFFLKETDVIDNLSSTSSIYPLSANQGKTLNDKIPNITMTTTDPGEGSALSAGNFIGVYGGDPIIMDYSTNEVNTGIRWINGATIYKKTVNTGTLPDTTSTTTAHGIANVSSIIKIEGYALATQFGYFCPLPTTDVNVYATDTNIVISTTSDKSDYQVSYVTLYYTKSS